MTEDQARYRKHLFSVRVWLEDSGDGQIEWRGKVQYVPSGEVRYFRGWPSLAAIMQAMLPNVTTNPFGPLQPMSGAVASEPKSQRTTGAGAILPASRKGQNDIGQKEAKKAVQGELSK